MTRPRHLPGEDLFAFARDASREAPLPVLVSGCLFGQPVGVDGSDYGPHDLVRRLLASERVQAVPFCPEDLAFGTPREWCDIHGGVGSDVLAGRARVLSQSGADWTDGMVEAARAMVRHAVAHEVRLGVLMDISAACGSQVIYDGDRTGDTPVHQAGQGVAAAALIEAGFPVCSQRDFATLKRLFDALGLAWSGPVPARDHHRSDWYLARFGRTPDTR